MSKPQRQLYLWGMKEYEDLGNRKPLLLQEPAAIYHRYGHDIDSTLTIALKAAEGLKAQALYDFERISGLSKLAVAKFLHVTSRSLSRYMEEDRKLDSAKSESLLKLIALYKKGTDVLGSKDEFNSWLAKPAFGLRNMVPFQLMETSSGIDLIDEELDRIAYGDVL